MPDSAIAAGCIDFVLSPEGIAKELARIASHPYVLKSLDDVPISSADVEEGLPDSPEAEKTTPRGFAHIPMIEDGLACGRDGYKTKRSDTLTTAVNTSFDRLARLGDALSSGLKISSEFYLWRLTLALKRICGTFAGRF